MRTLQRWLSDLYNILFHAPDAPDQLMPWHELIPITLGLAFLIFMMAIS
jgi:hypothetical protein